MNNPLERLLVDGQELDKELLSGILEPYVRIDRSTLEIRGTEAWRELNATQRTILYLLARKGMAALSLIAADDEKAAPNTIEKQAGVKGSTLRPVLSALYRERVLEKVGSAYFVPSYGIERAKTYVAADRRTG